MSINGSSSGLDVQGMVRGLMKFEGINYDRLTAEKSSLKSQSNQFSQLNKMLEQLGERFEALNTLNNKNSFKINTSNNSAVSVALTNTETANLGHYQIEVSQLAQAQRVASAAFSTRDTALNLEETLILKNNQDEEILNLEIEAGDTLEEIRNRINNSENEHHFIATIITTTEAGETKYRLVIQSGLPGLTHEFTIPPESESALLGVDQDNPNLNVLQEAQDALFTIDGFDVQRSSNTITDVIDGVSFTLHEADTSASINITHDKDNRAENLAKALNAIVNDYNKIMSFIDETQSLSPQTDSTYRHVKNYIQSQMTRQFENDGPIKSLLDLGITLAPSESLVNSEGKEYVTRGQLVFDQTKVMDAIHDNYDAVLNFFSKEDMTPQGGETPIHGFGNFFVDGLMAITEKKGPIDARVNGLNQESIRNEARLEREEARLKRVEAQLIKRFTALDNMLTMQDSKMSWLQNQFQALENMMAPRR